MNTNLTVLQVIQKIKRDIKDLTIQHEAWKVYPTYKGTDTLERIAFLTKCQDFLLMVTK
jgi:3-deoxy-D-manno-octulosonic acid (KDO) 8-phosphate synthase